MDSRPSSDPRPGRRKAPVDLIVHSSSQLLTLSGGPQRGAELGRLGLIPNGAVAVRGRQIVAVGPTTELLEGWDSTHKIDASGHVVMPGFVDPHTHFVWAGDRAAEFERRLTGATYLEILAEGGGIMSTVRQTRATDLQSLIAQSRPRLQRMLQHGTTTAEVKTGYGLELETELRMMEAILTLDSQGPSSLTPTFLGAHAVPTDFSGRASAYVDLICDKMLPRLKDWWGEKGAGRSLPFVDVFCEVGAFDLAQSRRILKRAAELGYPLKIHADEFAGLGGTRMAVELGAVSADHLVHTPPEDIAALGGSDTVAVALPATPFGLGEREYTPARQILESNGLLALASDLNPGTAWGESMQFVIALACRMMKLTPAEAIAAATINAAAAVGLSGQVGSLDPGKAADLIVLDTPDYRHLAYRFGTNLVSQVIKGGRLVSAAGG
ncbi:MAG TPA: imidazolonepropionase [Anaerolineales bacterium]|nr:imidazolonepropionase [Anaerolineales bacterium]